MMKNARQMKGLAMALVLVAAGTLPARADWVPTTGGTYDYGAAANWAGGVSNNVFLSSNYLGTAQTITLATDTVWNANATVVTAHTNATTLLLKATGSDRNLVLGAGVRAQGGLAWVNNNLQFGTVTANEKINFSLPRTATVFANQDSGFFWCCNAIFNGALSGAGGLTKTGNGNLYLQNAASSFSGPLEIDGGQLILTTAGASLATTNIIIGRSDASGMGAIGNVILDNMGAPVGTTSGSIGANTNRIPDNATVDMRGGSLRMRSDNVNNSRPTETVGTVNLTRGLNSLVVTRCWSSQYTTNNVTTLHIASLNRAAGTGMTGIGGVNDLNGFDNFGIGAPEESRIIIDTINGAAPSAAVTNGIIPWAVNGTQAGGYYWSQSYNGGFLTYGPYGLTPVTNYVTDITLAGPTDNVKLTSGPTLTTNRTVNSLFAPQEVYGATLTLASGAASFVGTAAGRLAITTKLDFNGQEAKIFAWNRVWIYKGCTNTAGNGLTYNGGGSANGGPGMPELWFCTTYPVSVTYTGPTRINGGLLRVGNNMPPSSAVIINEGGAFDLQQNNTTIASLSGCGYVWFFGYVSGYETLTTSACTLTVGGDNTSTTYAGAIQDSWNLSYMGHVVKTGTGTLTLSGTNSYSGVTTVSGGGLVVNGALTAGTNAVTVQSGAFLGGSGTIGRSVTVNSGALLAAGLTNTVGTLNISSNLNMQAGAVLDIQLVGTNSYDRIAVGGAVNLNSNSGAGSTLRLSVAGALRSGQQFTIIDNQSAGAVQGAFSCGSSVSAGGYRFAVAYNGGTGNDVVLTVRPKGTVISVW